VTSLCRLELHLKRGRLGLFTLSVSRCALNGAGRSVDGRATGEPRLIS
jgi:hypothetical protein